MTYISLISHLHHLSIVVTISICLQAHYQLNSILSCSYFLQSRYKIIKPSLFSHLSHIYFIKLAFQVIIVGSISHLISFIFSYIKYALYCLDHLKYFYALQFQCLIFIFLNSISSVMSIIYLLQEKLFFLMSP